MNYGSKRKISFGEKFVFTNEAARNRGKYGYQAYNANGDNIGIVYKNDDERMAAFGNCELCMYPAFYTRYGEWHIIKSYGSYVPWEYLVKQLQNNAEYSFYID